MKNIALLFALALLSGCATHYSRYDRGAEEVYWAQPPVVYDGYVVHEHYDTGYSVRHQNQHSVPSRHPPAPNFGSPPQTPHSFRDDRRGNSGGSKAGTSSPPDRAVQPKPTLRLAPTRVSEMRQNFQNHQQGAQAAPPAKNEAARKPEPRLETNAGRNKLAPSNTGNAAPKINTSPQRGKTDMGSNVKDRLSPPAGKASSNIEGKFTKRR